MEAFLGIDQGSSSTKVVLVDPFGKLLWKSQIESVTYRLPGNRVEQDANKILTNVKKLLNQAEEKAKQTKINKIIVGLSTQRSAVTAWDKNGLALHPLLTWRDRRTEESILKLDNHKDEITKLTGLPLLPDYAGSKISLLQKIFPTEYVGTLDSFLAYNLCKEKEFVTDDSMASRSLLYDLEKGKWSEELCTIFGVDKHRLAKICPSNQINLTIDSSIKHCQLCTMLGDGQSALYSQLDGKNQIILNLGTVAGVSIHKSNLVKRVGFLTGIFYSTEKSRNYLFEAVTTSCGEVVTRIVEYLKIKELEKIMQEVSASTSIPKLKAYLPINGTGSPDWKYNLPLVFSDEPKKYSDLEVMQASLLSIASFIAKNILIIKQEKLAEFNDNILPTAGGLSQSEFLLKYLSSVTKITYGRCVESEASALGIIKLSIEKHVDNLMSDSATTKIVQLINAELAWSESYYNEWLKFEEIVVSGKFSGFNI